MIDGVTGSGVGHNGGQSTIIVLGAGSSGTVDELQSITLSNVDVTTTDNFILELGANVGNLTLVNVKWESPVGNTPLIQFRTGSSAINNLRMSGCVIYRNTSGTFSAWWGTIPSGDAINRIEMDGISVVNEQGQSYGALGYMWDVQSGGTIGTFVLDGVDPSLEPTLLNGNQWSRITSFYGVGVSTYYRNTTYANLPPATFTGLKTTISDSAAAGVWGATETG